MLNINIFILFYLFINNDPTKVDRVQCYIFRSNSAFFPHVGREELSRPHYSPPTPSAAHFWAYVLTSPFQLFLSVAFLIQLVPKLVLSSSSHLVLGHPRFLFPRWGTHVVRVWFQISFYSLSQYDLHSAVWAFWRPPYSFGLGFWVYLFQTQLILNSYSQNISEHRVLSYLQFFHLVFCSCLSLRAISQHRYNSTFKNPNFWFQLHFT